MLALALASPATSQAAPAHGVAEPPMPGAADWARVNTGPQSPVDARPFPPRVGRTRCIGMNNIATAQMFGDSALELGMRDGRHFRIFFARECMALSFYQGFYYRRARAGRLCAGRDVIGSRSGGECRIASIIEVQRFTR